jgi:hypothetical protein
MKHTQPIARAATAALLIAGAGPANALSSDAEAACGAILCLVGGAGIAECAPYLARYFAIDADDPRRLFKKRRDFLNLCPTDLPADVRPMIARYGAPCQPGALLGVLNGQIASCELRAAQTGDDCTPTGNEWQICAAFYDHGYTIYAPPQLAEQCTLEREDGYLTERCSYTWTAAPAAAAPAPAAASASAASPLSGSAPAGFERIAE